MSPSSNEDRKVIATNRKARHDYEVVEKLEAGLVLTGTEVKSLRDGRANLKDSYVIFKDGEAFLFGTHISPYDHGNRENHEPTRTRKLLLHRRQLEKLHGIVTQKGLTIVPLELYFIAGRVKAEIAVVRGRKLHDKREVVKQREAERETRAAIKEAGKA
ncbi:MAG: SsrA-binding protein SmpB [Acidobacteria bacterium]|nr:SsrA-binding protein SmpB [Acidobacteriota bacterium]